MREEDGFWKPNRNKNNTNTKARFYVREDCTSMAEI